MTEVLVAGAAGRMGKRVLEMVHQHPDTTLAGAFEQPGHPAVNQDAGQVAGLGDLGVTIAGSLEEVIERGEVLIDFTAPEASLAHLRIVAVRG